MVEGRATFANMQKYIRMTASSNFGNVLSVLVASAFLPFLPMLPIHLLVQNLLYDLSQTAIPFDNVDADAAAPLRWEPRELLASCSISAGEFALRPADLRDAVVGVPGPQTPPRKRCSRAAGSSRACCRRRSSCT